MTLLPLLGLLLEHSAGKPIPPTVEQLIERANQSVKAYYALEIGMGQPTKSPSIIAVDSSTGNTIHIQNRQDPAMLDLAGRQLDSALAIAPHRADIWIGRAQLGGLRATCTEQVRAFRDLVRVCLKDSANLRLPDGRRIESTTKFIRDEMMNSIRQRWKEENDSCVVDLARELLVSTGPSIEPFNVLANVYSLNDVDSADHYYQMAIRLDPGDDLVANNFILHMVRKGRCEEARRQRQEAQQRKMQVRPDVLDELVGCRDKKRP